MNIQIGDQNLAFLGGSDCLNVALPIRVIRAARTTVDLLKAITDPSQMRIWKSLNYQSLDDCSEESGSVSVLDEWRMGLQVETNTEGSSLKITKIWREANDN